MTKKRPKAGPRGPKRGKDGDGGSNPRPRRTKSPRWAGVPSTFLGGMAVLALVGLAWAWWQPNYAHSLVPEKRSVVVKRSYPHDRAAFTQGLVWADGRLFEGTGLYGRSVLRRVGLDTGRVEAEAKLPRNLFGEGIAIVGDRIFQLTWREHRALVWDRATFEKRAEFPYEGEGWGLCWNGTFLVMSDGSDRLSFRDPDTFKEDHAVFVRKAGQRFHGRLNELECVKGHIYANVWMTEDIVQIDEKGGAVVATIDASGLLTAEEARGTDVLNGIAYVPERKTFLLTGKEWPKIFEVEFSAAKKSR